MYAINSNSSTETHGDALSDIHAHRILILDFGSQYTQLIARRVRESGVYCEIYPYDASAEMLETFAPAGIILSGGYESVTEQHTPRVDPVVFELGCPVLGICYGLQTMALQLGGKVASAEQREYGYAQVMVQNDSFLLRDISDHLTADNTACLDVWMSHGDKVTQLPPEFVVIASTQHSPFAGMAHEGKHFYGLQFHPEVTHTLQGQRILNRFLHEICGCASNWTSSNIIDDRIHRIQNQVGSDQVLLALSGGVDSSVAAVLLHKAIGDQLTCIFVDTGLLRHQEGDEVMSMFHRHLGIRVIRVNAEMQFYQALQGVTDPEQKRKIIGREFIRVFEQEAQKLSNIRWLAQGTIYPDVIESAAIGKAQAIKSHHNVGGLPENMNFQLIEPLRELFKDEVRKIGLELGLPYDVLYRHPFPGPGLGVRILGDIQPGFIEILRAADHLFITELRAHGWYEKVSQAFAVFLPVKSVGVIGDARRYDYVIALRAVETIDFMTARWAEIPHAILHQIAQRILNEVPGVSRVVYDISGKPPATIEWE